VEIKPFTFVFVVLLAALLSLDAMMLGAHARKAWWTMFFLFTGAGAASLYTAPFFELAELLGVGRPVDLVLYIVTVVLIRELFLSRARTAALERQITDLARKDALTSVVEIVPESDSR
jgi:hypothetical protein